MSVLAAYIRPSSNSEIVKVQFTALTSRFLTLSLLFHLGALYSFMDMMQVNLLASTDQDKGHLYTRHSHPLCSSGG